MAKENTAVEAVETTTEPKLGRIAQFRTNHPRIMRALTVTGVAAVVGLGAYGLGQKKARDDSEVPTFDGEYLPTDPSSES